MMVTVMFDGLLWILIVGDVGGVGGLLLLVRWVPLGRKGGMLRTVSDLLSSDRLRLSLRFPGKFERGIINF